MDIVNAKVIPIASITKILFPKRNGKYISIYVNCPFCNKEHKHGGGESLQNIAQFFGPRLSDCQKGQYMITDQQKEQKTNKSYDPDYIREYHRNYYHQKLKKTKDINYEFHE
jgi:hypothetical protein